MSFIRREQTQDVQGIREVNVSAFGQPQEADIVDELRWNCTDLLSLVAVRENRIVGHILFSPARIQNEDRILDGMARTNGGAAGVPATGDWLGTGTNRHRRTEGPALSVCECSRTCRLLPAIWLRTCKCTWSQKRVACAG
jgi:hypothetical protein